MGLNNYCNIKYSSPDNSVYKQIIPHIILMGKETRAGKYGRFLAVWVEHTICEQIKRCPMDYQKEDYRKRFLHELCQYSFEPRKKGSPKIQGCKWELESLDDFSISGPEELAKLVKEGIHLMYQKQTAARVFRSLKYYLDIS